MVYYSSAWSGRSIFEFGEKNCELNFYEMFEISLHQSEFCIAVSE